MEIFLSDIPEEGLPLSGKLRAAFFQLDPDDNIRISDDVSYHLTLYRFEESVVMSGNVEGKFEFQCVTCLEFFPYSAEFPSWQSELDVEEGMSSFDPRESLRDEILLALPGTPHCDELIENRECPKTSLLSKFEHDGMPLETDPETDNSSSEIWGALDQLEEKQQ